MFSGVRRSNGAQGLRIIVQSDRHPEYLDTRIELFIHTLVNSGQYNNGNDVFGSLGETSAAMDDRV